MNIPVSTASSSPACRSHATARFSVLTTVMRCEWLLLRSDLTWWTAIALLLGCMGYAIANGRGRLAEHARIVSEAQQQETKRLAALTSLLGRIERHEVKRPDAPFRDPSNAIYVGRGQAATVAYLPDAPLAIAGVGLSDLYPDVFQVSAGSKDRFLFVDEIANPTHLLTGSFDLAFVIVYLYPLILLVLSYNILSGEQEQGTLALTAASSARLTTVLGGKLMVRAGGPILAAVAGTLVFMLVAGTRLDTASGLPAFGLLALTIVAYGFFWLALALAVNSLRRDSAFNAVALVMAWVLLLLVAPAAINATAQVLYPPPPRAEMVLAVRNAAIDAERDRDATEARYRAEHRETSRSNTDGATGNSPAIVDSGSARALAVTLAADVRADAVLAKQEAMVRTQRQVSDAMTFLVPPALVNDALAELAGNGFTRWDDYLARIGEFHRCWQSFFVERARRGESLTTGDYRQFPRFESSDVRSAWFETAARRVLVVLAWVGTIAVALLLWANHRLARPQ